MLTLIEKAQEDFDEERAKKIEQKMRKNEFDFEMYLESMSQMKKMGGLSSILGMMPGLGMGAGKMPDIDEAAAEKSLSRTEGDHLFHDAGGETESFSLIRAGSAALRWEPVSILRRSTVW